MGLVYYGIHEEIALAMRDKYGLRALVETGTWHGDTAEWAADKFEIVITIEIIEQYYKDAKERLSGTGVVCLPGDSREVLPRLAEGRTPTLWWLDAHWTGHPDYKVEYGKCAALEEIAIINTSKLPHVIMVDDYALFPNLMEITPNELINALLNDGQRRVTIEDDIFYAEPKDMNWISIDKLLPKDEVRVRAKLVLREGGTEVYVKRSKNAWYWQPIVTGFSNNWRMLRKGKITHWISLPEKE